MSDEPKPTEPAIPVVGVPLASLRELLDAAARDWPQASQPGALVSLSVDGKGVAVVAELQVTEEWSGRVLATRKFDGDWGVTGQLRWIRRQ